MALRACPRCEATYLGTVAVCADCRLPLVDLDEGGAVVAGDVGPDGPPAGSFDPGADDAVGYDLGDWSADQQAELSATLVAERIAYAWDGDELVVGEEHADVVEELIDDLDHPDALDPDEDDGDDTGAQLLSDLYVASDVLVGDPDNRAAVTELLQAGEAVGRATPPFGVDRATWSTLAAQVDRLAGLLGEDAAEDVVVAAARDVRDTLRPLV